MFHAQLFQDFVRRLSAPGLQVIIALPDAFYRFLIVLAFPFEISGQGVIERRGGVLSMPSGIVVELRFTFRR